MICPKFKFFNSVENDKTQHLHKATRLKYQHAQFRKKQKQKKNKQVNDSNLDDLSKIQILEFHGKWQAWHIILSWLINEQNLQWICPIRQVTEWKQFRVQMADRRSMKPI